MKKATPRVAIVHYWLTSYRGGERVLSHLLRLLPGAVVHTLFADRALCERHFPGTEVRASFLDRIPFARRRHGSFLPLMPYALERFDLSGFDWVLSSESGPAKGVLVPPGVPHLCYCHSPMRYLYELRGEYESRLGPLSRTVFRVSGHLLRPWDYVGAQRLTAIAANSAYIGERVRRWWGRESEVIHPPVDLDAFANETEEGYYLAVSQLVPYKRLDLAVDAFKRLDLPLVVAGDGPELKRLRARAGARTRFLGPVGQDALRRLYARCRAFIFPGIEDFGIAPVEANASGKPVIAYARGGLLETQTDETAVWFHEQTADALAEAVTVFEKRRAAYRPDRIRQRAMQFHPDVFRRRMAAFIRRHAGV